MGIDLGTTNSLVAYVEFGEAKVISVDPTELILIDDDKHNFCEMVGLRIDEHRAKIDNSEIHQSPWLALQEIGDGLDRPQLIRLVTIKLQSHLMAFQIVFSRHWSARLAEAESSSATSRQTNKVCAVSSQCLLKSARI